MRIFWHCFGVPVSLWLVAWVGCFMCCMQYCGDTWKQSARPTPIVRLQVSDEINIFNRRRPVTWKRTFRFRTEVVLLLVVLAVVLSVSAAGRHTLIINGQSTEVPVIFVSGHPYVGLEALANALNGSVSSSGAVVALSLPVSSPDRVPSPTAAPTTSRSTAAEVAHYNTGFSREFLNAGIEQMSTLREWHAALQTAIETGIPLSDGLFRPYRAQATTNLHLASVAATTPADRNAYELLNKVYVNMGKLSDKYVNMRASLTYIAPEALQNDELNQRIIRCGHFLGAMAASGQFTDDGSCH
jgi:hypothetical protein